MKKRTILAGSGLAIAATLGLGGIAFAQGQDGDAAVPDADKAKVEAAGLAEVGNGKVTGSELESDGSYEVEVTRDDGTEVDVHLDKNLTVTSTEADDHDDHD